MQRKTYGPIYNTAKKNKKNTRKYKTVLIGTFRSLLYTQTSADEGITYAKLFIGSAATTSFFTIQGFYAMAMITR